MPLKTPATAPSEGLVHRRQLACMWALAAALVSQALLPQRAGASGIAAPAAGSWECVTAATVSSMQLNPATLTLRQRRGWQLDLGGVLAQADYTRHRRAAYQHADGFGFKLPLHADDIDANKTGPAATVSGVTRLPTAAVAAATPLGDRAMIGLSIAPAQAAVLKLPDDGPQRWQLREAFVLMAQASLGASVRVGDRLHLGGALDLVVGSLSLRQVMDLAATDMLGDAFADPPINQPNDFGVRAPPAVRELDVLSRSADLHAASALGVAFKLGALLELGERARLALAWQQGADLTFVGDFYLDMDHPFFTTDLRSQGLQYPRQVKGRAWVVFPTPSVLRGGLSVRFGDVTQHLQLNWSRYSVVRSLDVTAKAPGLAQPQLGLGDVTKIAMQRDWNDTFELEGLTVLDLGDAWRVGLRLGYHSPVSPDATMDLLSLDGHRLVGGLSARLRLSPTVAVTAHASGQKIIEREVVGSRHDRGNGTYNLAILVLGVGLQQSF